MTTLLFEQKKTFSPANHVHKHINLSGSSIHYHHHNYIDEFLSAIHSIQHKLHFKVLILKYWQVLQPQWTQIYLLIYLFLLYIFWVCPAGMYCPSLFWVGHGLGLEFGCLLRVHGVGLGHGWASVLKFLKVWFLDGELWQTLCNGKDLVTISSVCPLVWFDDERTWLFACFLYSFKLVITSRNLQTNHLYLCQRLQWATCCSNSSFVEKLSVDVLDVLWFQ